MMTCPIVGTLISSSCNLAELSFQVLPGLFWWKTQYLGSTFCLRVASRFPSGSNSMYKYKSWALCKNFSRRHEGGIQLLVIFGPVIGPWFLWNMKLHYTRFRDLLITSTNVYSQVSNMFLFLTTRKRIQRIQYLYVVTGNFSLMI